MRTTRKMPRWSRFRWSPRVSKVGWS